MKKEKLLALALAVAGISSAVASSCGKKSDVRTESTLEPTIPASEPQSETVVTVSEQQSETAVPVSELSSNAVVPDEEKSIISLLSDPELCLLEHLTYIDEKVAAAASVDFYRINDDDKGKTVAEILSVFDEKAIAALSTHTEPVCDAKISGLEWARLLEFIQNSRIASLVLEDIMFDENGYNLVTDSDGRSYSYPLAMCFSDGSGSKEAIVAFKGTTGPAEWADDVRAATVFDTPLQRKALEFVQGSAERFGSITAVGHSKGSNKAMYSTIMCEDVIRCVGFDGQGFSKTFIESPENAERIKKRASLIKNYSLTGDFVNILLYQIPGSHQLFCKGYCVNSVGENHSPNSFFQQSEEADGGLKYETVRQGDKIYWVPLFEVSSEDPNMEKLRSFTDYMLADGDNAEDIIDYIARILPVLMTGEDEDGNKYDSRGKIKVVMSDPASLSALIGGLRQFAKENELNGAYVDSLLGVIGIDDYGLFSRFSKK